MVASQLAPLAEKNRPESAAADEARAIVDAGEREVAERVVGFVKWLGTRAWATVQEVGRHRQRVDAMRWGSTDEKMQVATEMEAEAKAAAADKEAWKLAAGATLERPGFLGFEGLEVRGARDLSHVPEGRLRAMKERGFAATDPVTGDPLILHHLDQNPAGPLVEMVAPRHNVWNVRQHPFGDTPGAGLSAEQRAAFNSQWRPAYWRTRAAEELRRRGLE